MYRGLHAPLVLSLLFSLHLNYVSVILYLLKMTFNDSNKLLRDI